MSALLMCYLLCLLQNEENNMKISTTIKNQLLIVIKNQRLNDNEFKTYIFITF